MPISYLNIVCTYHQIYTVDCMYAYICKYRGNCINVYIYIYALIIHFCKSVCLYHFTKSAGFPHHVPTRQLRAKMCGPTWYNIWLVWIHVEHISMVGMLQVDCWPGQMGRT